MSDLNPHSHPVESTDSRSAAPWYKRIGPGLITACVVIGPGSITTSSIVGSKYGYSLLWVVLVSVLFMVVFMTMGARLGAVAADAPGNLIRAKAGRWLAILVGMCVFFISAAFQSGNNRGVAAAFEAFTDSRPLIIALVVGFNVMAISFLFLFQNMYKVLERMMTFFVGAMLLSFAVNLLFLKPDVIAMTVGFVPTSAEVFNGEIGLEVLGLVGTTFVITAAFYQAYLVRQKGWAKAELANGLLDARVGSAIMAVITIILMSTTAAGFYGMEKQPDLSNVVAIASALQGTFGSGAKIIFCLGLFSAAYSSFIVNSMIGGFMAADGFGLGEHHTDRWPRIFTTLALLTGMFVALATLALGIDATPTLIAAQAVTVVGAPLVAGVLLWLTSRRDIMGDNVNGPATKIIGGIGFLMLLAMAANTAFIKIPQKIEQYRNPPAQKTPVADTAVEAETSTPENQK
ncbi:MAG: Nramp family divalent metal transporter [Planctomycetaceae bacterium]|nr:Nramp family divalent metal transporter [Planctomycetaceae bacterium]